MWCIYIYIYKAVADQFSARRIYVYRALGYRHHFIDSITLLYHWFVIRKRYPAKLGKKFQKNPSSFKKPQGPGVSFLRTCRSVAQPYRLIFPRVALQGGDIVDIISHRSVSESSCEKTAPKLIQRIKRIKTVLDEIYKALYTFEQIFAMCLISTRHSSFALFGGMRAYK